MFLPRWVVGLLIRPGEARDGYHEVMRRYDRIAQLSVRADSLKVSWIATSTPRPPDYLQARASFLIIPFQPIRLLFLQCPRSQISNTTSSSHHPIILTACRLTLIKSMNDKLPRQLTFTLPAPPRDAGKLHCHRRQRRQLRHWQPRSRRSEARIRPASRIAVGI